MIPGQSCVLSGCSMGPRFPGKGLGGTNHGGGGRGLVSLDAFPQALLEGWLSVCSRTWGSTALNSTLVA